MAPAAQQSLIKTGMSEEDFLSMVGNVEDKRLHIVDVFTTWCGPCQQMTNTFSNLQVNTECFEERVSICQIDRATIESFKEKYPFTCKPLFLFYQKGQLVREVKGVQLPEILETINEYLPKIEADED